MNTEYSTWDAYPRPQMRRDSYFPLNGMWDLFISRGEQEEALGKICVPYPPESALSGIERTLKDGERWIYRRHFVLPDDFCRERILLHIGAADQIAEVTLNCHALGEHTGGYHPFSFDVTPYLCSGENLLTVTVTDELDTDLPYGKQKKKRGGMWYTPFSGLWQTVWMESVPDNAISSLRISPDLHGVTVETIGGGTEKTLIWHDGDESHEIRYTGSSVRVDVPNPRLWSPEEPHLYSFTITDGCDRVESYFALRTITRERRGSRTYICLNGEPYFFHGLLDQGYFPDGICTPASPDVLYRDIQNAKSLGYNMLRKHIKIEPALFYHFCDVCGMAVFQDMVNSGKYSFILDTALPTIGIKHNICRDPSPRRREYFELGCRETAELLYNYPSVCYYTIFNEGWGQYDADRIYTEMKAIDPSRIWDSTSGWFAKRLSDVTSEHVYFRSLKLRAEADFPLVLSEFGGNACPIEGHTWNPDQKYGYGFYDTPAAFSEALEKLYTNEVIPAIREGLSAAVLTQISDVEDEINGLFTYDRAVCKVDRAAMREIAAEMQTAFHENIPG